ncbi:MAG: hypothetical protein HQM09_24760 [Candidatus Riflebacteria bacterium]|nr:hypothetical protein [Candidatus Riflebacteria bacterium]
MISLKELAGKKPWLTSLTLWILAGALTLRAVLFQESTGPTHPLKGEFKIVTGQVRFNFSRSETIGSSLNIMILDPIPDGFRGFVKYRRYKSDDDWRIASFSAISEEFTFVRHGRAEVATGRGIRLPSLQERAGKYEYFVYLGDAMTEPLSVTGDKAVLARYKAEVPAWAIAIHVFLIFAALILSVRTVLEAMIDGNFKWLLGANVIALLLGGFVFGPLVQKYAFGVWWSGIPYGHDWTDNKVLVELIFWDAALILNRGAKRNKCAVYLAGIVTLLVYFIPPSIFWSEFDYRTGPGHGTTG